MNKYKLCGCMILLFSISLVGCQSIPATTTSDIDNDVCIGEAVVVDPEKPVDLEEMAKQADCP